MELAIANFSHLRPILECLKFGLFAVIPYVLFLWFFHTFKIHGRFGIFKVEEPEIHYQTALRNSKVAFIWGVGVYILTQIFHINILNHSPRLTFEVPEQLVILQSPNLGTDIFYAIIGFYLVDLLAYLGHRLTHSYPFFYKKFPVGHFVHHNYIYVNPLIVTSSPLIHLPSWTAFVVYLLMLSQGLFLSTAIIYIVRAVSTWTSHLGCDPLPWLTYINHKVGGWIPWIPLYHQYHHLNWVSSGNYGNLTCLWDYVFGTLIPESIYHIEHGHPLPEVVSAIPTDDEMAEFLKDKTRFSLP